MKANRPIVFRDIADDMEAGTWNLSSRLPYQTTLDSHSRAWEEEWERQESLIRLRIDGIGKKWATCEGEEIIPASREEQYWLRLRLVAASRFLYQVGRIDGSSIFSVQNMPLSEFISWMLIPWWADVGHREALYQIINRPRSDRISRN